MKFLSAPWRWKYIGKLGEENKTRCVFCEALKSKNDKSLICHRGKNFFIILNKYPYCTGHLMIVPFKHLDTPDQISPQDSVEMWELMNKALAILKTHFKPGGFNIGMNVGRSAGAGVKDHFHLHIVPRWPGDANFMAVVGNTRVLSYDMDHVYDVLKKGFEE